jgi:hypothetical protein
MLLAVAEPVTRFASLVVSAANAPFEDVLHFRSAAGLLVRAGAPGEVFVAVQRAAAERMLSVQAAFALIVSVGPPVVLKPASKSAGVGAVSAVEPGLIWSLTTRPAVIETLPGTPQLAGAPVAVHCATAVADAIDRPAKLAIIATPKPFRLILSPVPL